MAPRDDSVPQTACCEICGVPLGDEVVIQEFADGSLVRLCTECAAGADVGRGAGREASEGAIVWPDAPPRTASSVESDPLEKTRELLMPVVDLIALQREMQGALERLAASLERFAGEMITDAQDKSAVESRLQVLEQELDGTRRQLSQAEALLSATGAGSDGSAGQTAARAAVPQEAPSKVAPQEAPAAPPSSADALEAIAVPAETLPPAETGSPQAAVSAVAQTSLETAGAPPETVPWPNGVPEAAGAALPAPQAAPAPAPDHTVIFRIEEVQATQRYFNESPFINRIRDVRRSLGKPKANVSRFPTTDPLALVTVTWDIVWYQYLVDLRRDISTTAQRVSLYREGMDLDELAFHFRDKNAVINDDGRLDASELEVKLLSDPSALITELSPDEAKLVDDATEEVWGQRISQEFKWDS